LKPAAARTLAGLATGLLFGLGLSISGMVNPEKVLAFLDLSGPWDPSLALVMLAAFLVTWVGYRVLLGKKPLFDERAHLPTRTAVDSQLITGAVLFGIGWGLAGYCPGPAVAALASGAEEPVFFLAALLAGSFVAGSWMKGGG
jgi:hypothetical protein